MAQWREAFRAFGAKPQRTRPSVEALLRRLETGLPRIDRITDVYNAVSIAFPLPVGGEDLAHYAGPARLVRADGDEEFGTVAAGQPVAEHPERGEVVWRDDRGRDLPAVELAPVRPHPDHRHDNDARCSFSTGSPRSAPAGCRPPRRN